MALTTGAKTKKEGGGGCPPGEDQTYGTSLVERLSPRGCPVRKRGSAEWVERVGSGGATAEGNRKTDLDRMRPAVIFGVCSKVRPFIARGQESVEMGGKPVRCLD